jgi:hypothetical protein
VTERTRAPSVSPAHPYLWGREGGRDGRLPGHKAGRDALHDPGEARRAMVLPSRPGVGGEPQDLGRTRAVHHVHHRGRFARRCWLLPHARFGSDKPILQLAATHGNLCRRIVAPKVAGSSPVGHPLRFRIGKPDTRKWSMLRC